MALPHPPLTPQGPGRAPAGTRTWSAPGPTRPAGLAWARLEEATGPACPAETQAATALSGREPDTSQGRARPVGPRSTTPHGPEGKQTAAHPWAPAPPILRGLEPQERGGQKGVKGGHAARSPAARGLACPPQPAPGPVAVTPPPDTATEQAVVLSLLSAPRPSLPASRTTPGARPGPEAFRCRGGGGGGQPGPTPAATAGRGSGHEHGARHKESRKAAARGSGGAHAPLSDQAAPGNQERASTRAARAGRGAGRRPGQRGPGATPGPCCPWAEEPSSTGLGLRKASPRPSRLLPLPGEPALPLWPVRRGQ